MNQPRYYAGDFEEAKLNTAFLILIVVFIGLCALVTSFVAGMEFQAHLYKEALRMESQKPKRAQPATFRPNIFCDRTEYARICRARERMTLVGAPK